MQAKISSVLEESTRFYVTVGTGKEMLFYIHVIEQTQYPGTVQCPAYFAILAPGGWGPQEYAIEEGRIKAAALAIEAVKKYREERDGEA